MARKHMGALALLLGVVAMATSAQAIVFGAGDGELGACGQEVFTAVNDIRASKGAPAIEPMDALIRMAQFKADNLASEACKVYNNEPYLHYACTGEGCNTCSNAASLWLSGLSFGGPNDLDASRQGNDKFSYELLTSAQTTKMGCATAAGWSDDAPCSVTVCFTSANLVKTTAKAEGKPDITFWLSQAAWVMPSNRVGDDKTDECPGLASQGLCGAGYKYTNAKWNGLMGDGQPYWVSVDQMCPGSCPTPAPVPAPTPKPRSGKKSKRSQRQAAAQRRMLRA